MTREQFIELVEQEQKPLRRFLLVLCSGNSSMADDIAQEALLKAFLSYKKFEGRSKFSTWLFRIAYNCFYDSSLKRGKLQFESLDAIERGREAREFRESDGYYGFSEEVYDFSADAEVYENSVTIHGDGNFGDGGEPHQGESHETTGKFVTGENYGEVGGLTTEETDEPRYENAQLYEAIGALPEAEKAAVLLFYMEERTLREITEITGMNSATLRSHLFRARRRLRKILENLEL